MILFKDLYNNIFLKSTGLAFALLIFSTCADQIDERVPTIFDASASLSVTSQFSSIQQNVFTPICATSRCHGGLEVPNLSEGLAYDNIVNVLNTQVSGFSRIKPGDPDSSSLFLKLLDSDKISGSRMPIDLPPLSPAAIDSIRLWIKRGALPN